MRFKVFIFYIIIWFFRGFIGEYIFGLTPEESRVSDPTILKIFLELPVLILFLMSLVKTNFHKRSLILIVPIILYFLCALISAYVNNISIINAVTYSRYLIYSLMLFFISYSTLNSREKIRKFVRVIFILCILQIIVSVFNLFAYGQLEGRIGTIAIAFGSLATIFPVTVLAFLISYYLVYKKSMKWLVFTFLFTIIGFASGKRAIVFIFPLFLLLFLLLSVKLDIIPAKKFITKYIVTLSLVFIIVLPFLNYYISNTDFGQSGNTVNKGFTDKIEQIFDYAKEYEQGTDAQGYSRGRSGTNLVILNSIYDNNTSIWGVGPMSLYDEETRGYGSGYTPMNILYGIVGWGRDALSIGFISVLFIIWYLILLFRKFLFVIKNKNQVPEVILFIALGGYFAVLVFIYDYFFYSANSFISGFPLFLITIAAGVIERYSKPNVIKSEKVN
ncbi:MAG TPA: hypothetical protein GXZ48_01300 [Acholeplasmataceae bacterium]|nr:hypothetical protein [Acholeplasmataceae bacterium]